MALIIADAGPLIALAQIEQLQVLQALFRTVTLPEAVWLETQAKETKDSQRIAVAVEQGWLSIASVEIQRHFPLSLHDGESEALQIACNEGSALLILDDQLARREAARLNLNFIGTVKVLSLAEQRGLIDSASASIEQMQGYGYRVSVKYLPE